ncbi:MAG: exo-alpha-sialidase, partial [Nitrospinae bacterium]|nr:exo-alpha-sialidase [Nitrospinota bacterium]
MPGYKKLLRIALAGLLALGVSTTPLLSQTAPDEEGPPGIVKKNGVDLDIRSLGRMIGDQIATFGTLVPDEGTIEETSPVPGLDVVPQIQFRGDNVQVNATSDQNCLSDVFGGKRCLDNIQTFPTQRPFVLATQSETAIAAHGPNIVVAYNTTANQPLVMDPVLRFTRRLVSGFSTSTDGGQTWTSGFLPPLPGSIFTSGDPALAVDRRGNFYFAGLGRNASLRLTIQVNTSTDGGLTWDEAVNVQQDNRGDKPWIAVGRDPIVGSRDNVYVTWTSLRQVTRMKGVITSDVPAKLNLGRSLDGGL